MDKAIITTSWDDGHPVVLKHTKLQTLKALEELCRLLISQYKKMTEEYKKSEGANGGVIIDML